MFLLARYLIFTCKYIHLYLFSDVVLDPEYQPKINLDNKVDEYTKYMLEQRVPAEIRSVETSTNDALLQGKRFHKNNYFCHCMYCWCINVFITFSDDDVPERNELNEYQNLLMNALNVGAGVESNNQVHEQDSETGSNKIFCNNNYLFIVFNPCLKYILCSWHQTI